MTEMHGALQMLKQYYNPLECSKYYMLSTFSLILPITFSIIIISILQLGGVVLGLREMACLRLEVCN